MFSPNWHNIFILTMPTASGQRSGAVCGEKSPKTRSARIYCYGNTLYIVNLIDWGKGCLRGSLFKANASDAVAPGFQPRRGLHFFFLIHLRGSVTDFWHLFEQPKIYIRVARKAREIKAHFC